MNLEHQVISLEHAKKLRELGVKQESLFCYTTDLDLEFLPTEIRNENAVVAAFTVSELLGILPDEFCTYRENDKYKLGWNSKWDKKLLLKLKTGTKKSPDALAMCLIYLIENGLVNNE